MSIFNVFGFLILYHKSGSRSRNTHFPVGEILTFHENRRLKTQVPVGEKGGISTPCLVVVKIWRGDISNKICNQEPNLSKTNHNTKTNQSKMRYQKTSSLRFEMNFFGQTQATANIWLSFKLHMQH